MSKRKTRKRKVKILISLSEDLVEYIDSIAKAYGLSRSALIELAFRMGFDINKTVEKTFEKIKGGFEAKQKKRKGKG